MKEDFDNPENWPLINEANLQFILSETEKFLLQTVETAQTITDKALNILQFSVALMFALVGFIASSQPLDNGWEFIGVAALVPCSFIIWRCIFLYGAYETMTNGNHPDNMIYKEKLIPDEEDQRKAFLIGAIHSMRNSINFNIDQNAERTKVINQIICTIKITTVGVAICAILYVIFLQFPTHCHP